MNRRPFIRKVIYLAAVAALLVPLSMLSMPAHKREGGEAAGGGYLARLRDENKLSQANLGEIDPTGAALKLATLGMQPIAVYVLQGKAVEARLKEDWTVLRATLDQLTKLQPNFVPAWQFQGWNLSYNISAEFDDYRDRYFWVIEGIRFLQQGTKYNETSPRLLKDVGWDISHKIGRADEHVQFRRLFVQDSDYQKHDAEMLGLASARPVELRDNWLVGREWFLKGQTVKENGGALGGMSELLFYEHAPRCRISYAEALEEDGVFGERAQVAWQTALKDWQDLGQRETPTYIERLIRLTDLDVLKPQAKQLREKLDAMPPGDLRAKIIAEKRKKLTQQERRAIDTPVEARTSEEHQLASAAAMKLETTHDEVAQRVDAEHRKQALELAGELTLLEEQIRLTESARSTVNYQFWLARCEMEGMTNVIDARRLIAKGEAAFAEGDLLGAQTAYEQGFAKWAPAVKQFPIVFKDSAFGDEMVEIINRYKVVLDKQEMTLPEDFVLNDVIEWHKKPG
jgi:hypothetical protein